MIMMAIAALVVSACGSSESSESSETNGTGKKELRVVTDAAYAPFEYMEGDKIVGFDVDFLKAAAKEAGYELKFDNVGWDPIFVDIDSFIGNVHSFDFHMACSDGFEEVNTAKEG